MLFGWQDHAQKIQGWGCRRGRKVQTDSWWVAQTWSAKILDNYNRIPLQGTKPTSEPNRLKLLMTPAISEWPNRMAAVENVLVIVGFTWNTFFYGISEGLAHLRVIAVYETLLGWLHAELLLRKVEDICFNCSCIFTCIYFIPSTIGSHSLYVMCCSSATTILLMWWKFQLVAISKLNLASW